MCIYNFFFFFHFFFILSHPTHTHTSPHRSSSILIIVSFVGSLLILRYGLKNVRYDILLLLLPGGLGGPYLGFWMLNTMDTTVLSQILTVFLVLVAVERFYSVSMASPDATPSLEPSPSSSLAHIECLPTDIPTMAATHKMDCPSPPPAAHVEEQGPLPQHYNIDIALDTDSDSDSPQEFPRDSFLPTSSESPLVIAPTSASPDPTPPPTLSHSSSPANSPPSGLLARLSAFMPLPWYHNLYGVASGVIAGVLSGLFGLSGPPIMIFFSTVPNLDKSEIRSTFAMMMVVMSPVRIVFAYMFGMWYSEDIPVYVLTPFVCVLGITVGNYFHHKVDKTLIIKVLTLFITIAAFGLSGVGDGSRFGHIMLFVLPCVLVAYILIFILSKYKQRQRERAAVHVKEACFYAGNTMLVPL